MDNSLNPISSSDLSSLLSSNSPDPLASALGGSSSFDSIFTQAMNQATTPAEKLEDAFLEVEYSDMNALYAAVSGDDTSTSSIFGSIGSLASDLGSASAQLSQLEQALGLSTSSSSSGTQPASNMGAALGLEAQQLMNNDLASFGTDTGSGIDALA